MEKSTTEELKEAAELALSGRVSHRAKVHDALLELIELRAENARLEEEAANLWWDSLRQGSTQD